MLLLSYMAEDSHTNGDYSASVRYCIEGLELAKKQGSKTYEADFNLGTETITLDGELHTPIEAGVEAAIIDWKVVDGGSVDAH